jgi:hypothetical protein
MKGNKKSDITNLTSIDQGDELDELDEDDQEDEEKVGDDELSDQSILINITDSRDRVATIDPAMQAREYHDLEAARKERMDLLALESKKIPPPASKKDRLDYLIAQSDVFAHFLAGTIFCEFMRFLIRFVCVLGSKLFFYLTISCN